MADSPENVERRPSQVSPELLEVRAIHLSQQHEGPLPSPEQLAAYEDRFPGFGERICGWVKRGIGVATRGFSR